MKRIASTAAVLVPLATVSALLAMTYRPAPLREPPDRIPEAAPYDTAEAQFFPPPFEDAWESLHNPARCATCHRRIFDEWNGSMMSNAWRDPAWRAAFLLIARLTATDGDCDLPQPPDGTTRAKLNPFAVGDACQSRFDGGASGWFETAGSGSLLDGFCSRCHMPTNYIDNVPLHHVETDRSTGLEHGRVRATFDPTSDHGTGTAFAKADALLRNTESGKRGIFCSVCHTMAASRDTPFHNLAVDGIEHTPALGSGARQDVIDTNGRLESIEPPAADRPNLGYGVAAGAFRLSPHAIGTGSLYGPLAAADSSPRDDPYLSEVFGEAMAVEPGAFNEHGGFRHTKFERAEMCATCHDVTNPLAIKNALGKWVGGFPIERTYTEWLGSAYADRPGNDGFDPARKRDCQTCHMQQDYGQPGTANTLYRSGEPLPVLRSAVATDAPERSYFSHHFIGGNAYVPRLIGADVSDAGAVESYPELSVFSFTSKDEKSPYSRAYWTNADAGAAPATQHARLAWDRLRHVVDLTLDAPAEAAAGSSVSLTVGLGNTGSGHKFPTGFPEGRIAWVAVRAFDLATGEELAIHDRHWNRTSRGVGYLTDRAMTDPTYPDCAWSLPAGSPDPYAYQLKAVATLGDGCPTLDLPYATPLNLVVDDRGLPIDRDGRVIGRDHPKGLPQFRDLDGDGDVFDDSFLIDTRLRPQPHAGAQVTLDRYAVVLPADVEGPVAVVGALYYQSLEAVVALKFLGNLADLDTDFTLEPCVLGGACDGRHPTVEPPVVEGAPPVAMEVVERVIRIAGRDDLSPPTLSVHPADGATAVPRDSLVKVRFSEPVFGVAERLVVHDARGNRIAASVDRVGDGTWALFPNAVFLTAGERYTAELAAGVCDAAGHCLGDTTRWSFRVVDPGADAPRALATGPMTGYGGASPGPGRPPTVLASTWRDDGTAEVTFSRPVMNVTPSTLKLFPSPRADCSVATRLVAITLDSDAEGRRFVVAPEAPLGGGESICVEISQEVYDLAGQSLARRYRSVLPRTTEPGP